MCIPSLPTISPNLIIEGLSYTDSSSILTASTPILSLNTLHSLYNVLLLPVPVVMPAGTSFVAVLDQSFIKSYVLGGWLYHLPSSNISIRVTVECCFFKEATLFSHAVLPTYSPLCMIGFLLSSPEYTSPSPCM